MNTFDEIIQTKAYTDLTSEELEVIGELISSEEEYNEMRAFYIGIGQLAIAGREEVSPSVKSSLNSVFQAKHPGISQSWNAPAEPEEKKIVPLYNRNLFRAAAVLVLSAGVAGIWFILSEDQQLEAKLTASTAPVTKEEEKAADTAWKKEFPINEESKAKQKAFTAQSDIPADEQVNQDVTYYTNAVQPSGTLSASSPEIQTHMWSSSSANMAITPASPNKSVATGSAFKTTSPATYSFSVMPKDRKKEAAKTESREPSATPFLKAGLDADLNPNGSSAESVKEYKPSIATTDLLSLIEPSF
jgi:hypothetical protein